MRNTFHDKATPHVGNGFGAMEGRDIRRSTIKSYRRKAFSGKTLYTSWTKDSVCGLDIEIAKQHRGGIWRVRGCGPGILKAGVVQDGTESLDLSTGCQLGHEASAGKSSQEDLPEIELLRTHSGACVLFPDCPILSTRCAIAKLKCRALLRRKLCVVPDTSPRARGSGSVNTHTLRRNGQR
jgi:hypothetical protein